MCLVGSVARGDARPDSDIDLLVVAEQKMRRHDLLAKMCPAARDPRLSFISYSLEGLMAEAASGSLFLHHVRLEGVTLHDRAGMLRNALNIAASRPPDVAAEIQRQLKRLRLYREPERLNGEHLFALAHLYAIGKGIAIARCVALHEPVFVKAEALKVVAEHHPELADDVAAIVELEPFYDLTRDRPRAALPFRPTNVEHKLSRAALAIERIAHG
jgi:nucleotidyltransferase-like protein